MSKSYLIETCVSGLQEAIRAEQAGAHRLELCDDLGIGGITPEQRLVEEVLRNVSIPVRLMVRPRGGDFCYDDREIAVMEKDIKAFKKLNIEGLVFGCLDLDSEIDEAATGRLARLAYPLKVTFHKAIDDTPDLATSLTRLQNISEITDILTSGGAETAFKGMEALKKLVSLANNKLCLIAAGKITHQNVDQLNEMIGAPAYHGRRIVPGVG